MSVTPIFLLSLPRAGSTLFQRLLSLHGDISTKSEPWIALPSFFALKQEGVDSVYSHKTLATGINGFVSSLPNGKDDYRKCVAEFMTQLYTLGADVDTRYFLDKTPRYHLIVTELLDAFPDAKFIFLWRNPLAVPASILQTYDNGKWNLYMFLVDLYSGVDSLVAAYTEYKSRVIAVRYEDLVHTPDAEIRRIISYLQLDAEGFSLDGLKDAEVMWGDRTGQHKYSSVSTASLDTWKSVMANPLRKIWAKKYLEWIGQDRLSIMGYSFDEIVTQLESQKTSYRYLMSDAIRSIYGKLYCRYSVEQLRRNKPWKDSGYVPRN